MMNLFLKTFLILPLITGIYAAHAEEINSITKPPAVRLVEINSEYYPDESFYLGYSEGPDHSISNIYYESSDQSKRYFTIKELSTSKTIIETTSGSTVYDLVRLSLRAGKVKNSYFASMNYMKNGLFKSRKSIEFIISFNPRRQIFELKSVDTNEIVNRVYASTNYWGNKAVGIASIISLK